MSKIDLPGMTNSVNLIRLLLKESSDLGLNCLQKTLIRLSFSEQSDLGLTVCVWLSVPILKILRYTMIIPQCVFED